MWLVVVVAAAVVVRMDCQDIAAPDHGLGLLDTIMNTDPSLLCSYVRCEEPVPSGGCPNNTRYMDNTAQFGCCGACVAFRQNGKSCTGSIDPMYDDGYTRDAPVPRADLRASLYNTSDSDNVVQSSWCDYSLDCFKGTCGKDSTVKTCASMLDHYLEDSETFKLYKDDYRWKPVCTSDGNFDAKQCKGPLEQQRCVCVDPDGQRLFGAAFTEQEELFNTMNCKCSRQAWEMKQAGQASVTHHCLENGNFEPLQCDDGWCYCVDAQTAEYYGFRLPETAMHMLPCYNKSLAGETYLRRCDSEVHAHAELMQAMADSGVRGFESLTTCDQDGSYTSRQCDQEIVCRGPRVLQRNQESDHRHVQVELRRLQDQQVQGLYKFCADSDGIRVGPLVGDVGLVREMEGQVMNNNAYLLECTNARLCQENGAAHILNSCAKVCTSIELGPLGESLVCPNEAYASYIPTET
ncbi:Equistatin [Chionoecetes opilio]|uniref:Equistatin n=1 Tax=Chionoecetes opilio TaxID=41210 RepID=A0A8J4YRI8_CHIOP|nr:Equistatin [Chionoecetes opilio]